MGNEDTSMSADPSGHTAESMRRAAESLPLSDTTDFADADRGFLIELKPGVVTGADGKVVWDNDSYSYIQGTCPNSVHPGLWRQAQLMIKQGLYEVTPGIYQIRGWICRT
ncbi:putative alkyl/aryl-sulfatase YjcS [Nocardia sp. RB20]|uniref:Putative alkyl/aryl-sulfatase YjcS n=1 Tax=Nocardia macrotermitis TaxID=2585198 RepID=A0A7K0CWG2_9NOCA|nr:putative alkyl/aryl-sulfatase YjcS [Nocardia macrotermitis]